MDTTKLSSKGQIIIPKDVRERRQWKPGQEFDVVETEEGVLLRPHRPFPPTRIEEVAGTLQWEGPAVPLERLSVEAIAYQDPQALQWFSEGLDLADALHLASSQHTDVFVTFDQHFIARAAGKGTSPVEEPAAR